MPRTSGNLSRHAAPHFVITPSGLPHAAMTQADLGACAPDGAELGQGRPSSEWRLHAAIDRARRSIPDRPGMLADIFGRIASLGDNVIEVQHEQLFGAPTVQSTELHLMGEARDGALAQQGQMPFQGAQGAPIHQRLLQDAAHLDGQGS